MNRTDLERLAGYGIAAFPPTRLDDAAQYCWDRGVATGDARHCLLWRSLGLMAQSFEERDCLPVAVVDKLDEALRRHLLGVLNASTAEEGSGIARILDKEIHDALGAWV